MDGITRGEEKSGNIPRGFVGEMPLVGEVGVLGERSFNQAIEGLDHKFKSQVPACLYAGEIIFLANLLLFVG